MPSIAGAFVQYQYYETGPRKSQASCDMRGLQNDGLVCLHLQTVKLWLQGLLGHRGLSAHLHTLIQPMLSALYWYTPDSEGHPALALC